MQHRSVSISSYAAFGRTSASAVNLQHSRDLGNLLCPFLTRLYNQLLFYVETSLRFQCWCVVRHAVMSSCSCDHATSAVGSRFMPGMSFPRIPHLCRTLKSLTTLHREMSAESTASAASPFDTVQTAVRSDTGKLNGKEASAER